ncbi:hypothetical protein [Streptomyces sp. NBC_01216]|uniref:hypothetical protein n=1 Tax=unclassified Streptomyces TaxID=2593676 RepID=UPI002E0D4877|nr:phosphodiester glycosidase family protein [Streptomyces sp. NBC_01216]
MTLRQSAEVVKWLGATEAIARGGGGDAQSVRDGALDNRPMDPWADDTHTRREVGNAVVLIKRP